MLKSRVLNKLEKLGQSVWYDNISRELLESGGLKDIISSGVRGLTSNPSIFQKAISGSSIYDSDIEVQAGQGRSNVEIFESLAIDDIRAAADTLHDVYVSSKGADGFASLEVNPHLADDTIKTVKEARRLFASVNKPNLMIKVPATQAGIPAIKTLISEGINVNVTLIFSTNTYEEVREAYISGLESRSNAGEDISNISSVASFFVSRVDSAIDDVVKSFGSGQQSLIGKSAIANAKVAYKDFQETFQAERFKVLKEKGARVQRPLWASTSTKNPSFSDVLYVESLIGPDTVTTMPDATLEAYTDHGQPELTITRNVQEAYAQLDLIRSLGIDIDRKTDELVVSGVKQFADSFDDLIQNISDKRNALLIRQT